MATTCVLFGHVVVYAGYPGGYRHRSCGIISVMHAHAKDGGTRAVEAYLAFLATPRGRLRAALERRALYAAVPALTGARPLRVLDAGCGPAPLGLDLAVRGHEVTLLDADPRALDRAFADAASHLADSTGALWRLDGSLQQLDAHRWFDVVLCHHVVEFCDDPWAALRAAAIALALGGVISTIVPNAAGMALQGYARDGDAESVFTALESGRARPGGCGERRWAFEARSVVRALCDEGLRARTFAGILVLAPLRADDDGDASLEKHEWALARRAPFRAVARHLHVVGSRQ